MEVFKYKKPLSLMSKSKRFGFLSITLIIFALATMFTKGFNYGIDFAGGTLIQVKYTKDAPIKDIRKSLEESKIYPGASVTYFGTNEEVIIRTKSSSGKLGEDVAKTISNTLKSTGEFEIRRVDMVGAKVGSELREKGLMAMLIAIIGILIYVSIRFEWRFAVASVMALVHDITITMGVLSFFSVELNLDILAAILTILGYSLNDTIIVFDRIREGIKDMKIHDLGVIIDESVSRTLSRTTLTSLTTFFVVFTLWMFGGEIIHGFGLTLLIGIIVGTYSSIFVASPILMLLGFSVENYKEKQAEKRRLAREREKERALYENGVL